jgi:hypothetical protein
VNEYSKTQSDLHGNKVISTGSYEFNKYKTYNNPITNKSFESELKYTKKKKEFKIAKNKKKNSECH